MVGSEDALRVRDDKAPRGVTERHLDLGDGRAFRTRNVIGLAQKLDLLCLLHAARFNLGGRLVTAEFAKRDLSHAASVSRNRCRRSCGRVQARFTEIGGVGETGGLSDHDTNTRSAITPRAQLLDSSLVKEGRRCCSVFDEDLCKGSPVAERFINGALQDISLN